MTRPLAAILLLFLLACDGDSNPSTPPDPLTLAAVETTLGFADAPLRGEIHIDPIVEGGGLEYAVDFDEDGRVDAEGPLLQGVRIGYRYDEPGVHDIRVWLRRDGEEESFRKSVVVNRPGLLDVLREARLPPASGIVATADEDRVYVSEPGDGLVVAARGFGLQRVWELELDFEFPGSGGLALSPDESVLYVDVGDSIAAIETAEPSPEFLGIVGPADLGASLATLPDGTILTGGDAGIARIDLETGAVLARYDERAGPFAVSADGRRLAFVAARSGTPVRLLDAETLQVLWETRLEVGFPMEATAVPSPDGEAVYAMIRADDRRFVVLDARDGAVERSLLLGANDRSTHGPRFLPPAAATSDGRWVAMVDYRHVWLVDTRNDLPLHRMDEYCCHVAASGERDVFFLMERFGETRKVEVVP